jgi:hypothetical protein
LQGSEALMAQIVRLSDYRKPAGGRRRGMASATQPHAPQALPNGTPHYFCLRCDTDQFKLYPGGTVHCAHCGALMRNISVRDSSPS